MSGNRQGVPPLLRFWIQGPDGVALSACSTPCLTAVTATLPATTQDRRPPTPLRPYGTCAHCAWCGELAATPANQCRVHEHSCPEFGWEFTVAGLRSVMNVRALAGVERLTPRALAAFSEVAGHLRGAGRYPDEALLVAGVMDRRVDWLP